jgi:GNAT superfamily N-acetyltransferase
VGIEVRRVAFEEIRPLRELYRREARCQIVRDSILPRGLADPYLLVHDRRAVGYAGVWTKHFPGRIMEVYVERGARGETMPLLRAAIRAADALEFEAQSNMPGMLDLLTACAHRIRVENLLYRDGSATGLVRRDCVFRERREDDEGPEGDWVVEVGGRVVAAGGVLTHYNPPFGDLYMEVIPEARRQGIGSYLVQELRRVGRENGLMPSARCDPDNVASRRALERGGMTPCGALQAGPIKPELLGLESRGATVA